MKEWMKKILSYKLPAYWVVIAIILISYGLTFLEKKPTMDLIPLQVAGAERIVAKLDKDNSLLVETKDIEAFMVRKLKTDKFIKTYLYMNLEEYRNIYRVSYGELPEDIEKLFDETLNGATFLGIK